MWEQLGSLWRAHETKILFFNMKHYLLPLKTHRKRKISVCTFTGSENVNLWATEMKPVSERAFCWNWEWPVVHRMHETWGSGDTQPLQCPQRGKKGQWLGKWWKHAKYIKSALRLWDISHGTICSGLQSQRPRQKIKTCTSMWVICVPHSLSPSSNILVS